MASMYLLSLLLGQNLYVEIAGLAVLKVPLERVSYLMETELQPKNSIVLLPIDAAIEGTENADTKILYFP